MHWSKFSQTQTTSLTQDQNNQNQPEDINFVLPTKNTSQSHLLPILPTFSTTSKSKLIVFGIIAVISVLGFYLFFINFSSGSASASVFSGNFNEISDKQLQGQSSNNNDTFDFNFVETQYQGKQTQQTLAKAAFSEMQKKLNIIRFAGYKGQQDQMQQKKMLQDISSLDVMIPDQSIDGYIAQNFYFFSVSIHDMIINSNLYMMYRNGQTIFKISLKQHMRAIIKTQLVHNVNFKGEVKVELSPFDKSIEEKQQAIRQIMDDEELYYESFYQLSKYNTKQLRFCIVVPSYNNVRSRLYLRNLDSIFMQDYQNYHVVYIDDASPDQTGEYVRKHLEDKEIPAEKIQIFINDKNTKAMYNIYNGIHSYCPDGQIVGLIDGDDSLLGNKVLQLYNAVYQEKRTALIYSNFLKILTNNKTTFGFGTELTKEMVNSGLLRHSMQLMGTHFMTFFSDLFKKIKKQDLCYQNGTFYDYAYDRAILTPMLEMAFPRVQYLAEITYEYRNDTGINDGTDDWERVSRIILNNKAYKQIDNFSFIDDFVDEAEAQRKKQQSKNIDPSSSGIFFEDFEQEINQKEENLKATASKQAIKI